MSCEKCWNDAYIESRLTGESQADAYNRLLQEANDGKRPWCTDDEQSGAYLDEPSAGRVEVSQTHQEGEPT